MAEAPTREQWSGPDAEFWVSEEKLNVLELQKALYKSRQPKSEADSGPAGLVPLQAENVLVAKGGASPPSWDGRLLEPPYIKQEPKSPLNISHSNVKSEKEEPATDDQNCAVGENHENSIAGLETLKDNQVLLTRDVESPPAWDERNLPERSYIKEEPKSPLSICQEHVWSNDEGEKSFSKNCEESEAAKNRPLDGKSRHSVKMPSLEVCPDVQKSHLMLSRKEKENTGQEEVRERQRKLPRNLEGSRIVRKRHRPEMPQSIVSICYKCGQCFDDVLSHRSNCNYSQTEAKPKPFTCNECMETFPDAPTLLVHERTHADENQYTCGECGTKYACGSDLIKHQESSIDCKKVHQCSECGQSFSNSVSLGIHQQVHMHMRLIMNQDDPNSDPNTLKVEVVDPMEKRHSCSECGKCFILPSKLISHMRKHTGERPYPCNDCGKSFRDTILLRKHQRIHTEEKPFSCDECGKTFGQKGYLFRHQKIHKGDKPHVCNLCGRGFTHSCMLSRHLRIHAGVKPHKCEECEKSFGDASSLSKHQLTHTGEKPFSCSECGKSFGRSCHLIRHLKMHSGELPFACSECGQTFADASSLTKHKLMHSGAKPYTCEECGKNYGRASHLVRHQQTHTGEKPFTCDECGRSFGVLTTLQKHQRTHTGEKPYTCNVCNKGFRDTSSLKIHQRRHTGEKPYKCTECGVRYSRSVYLKRHVKTHMGLNPHMCDCGLSFPDAYHLTNHQLNHTEVLTHTL